MEKKVKRSYTKWTKDKIFASAMGVSLEEYLVIKVKESELIYEHDLAEFGEKVFERLYFNDGELFLYESHFVYDDDEIGEKIISTPVTLDESSSWFCGGNIDFIYNKRRPYIDSIPKEKVNKWIDEMNEWVNEMNYNIKKIEKLNFNK